MLAKFFVFVTLPSCIYTRFVLRPIGIEFKSQGSRKDGCSFRLRHYKIGDTWHPELYPFGIQRCVLCSCIKDRHFLEVVIYYMTNKTLCIVARKHVVFSSRMRDDPS
ncbi:predicted protein [Nematostella vectensis]|uniref:Secreted protein n=1 Tax=Nematostella vectensis TaxID=45351 RepID=A7T468_NEMVE|nr:predicted protein [Nematostella vectensis]|eukprot:XP_001621344.1 hypothetical protein NEMVEDRAFT_v1g222078 [Nematostella vectensis]